ncbi:hypothetical protein [Nonomuraea lactucae]|uniref:hypothetical protein n=1 Tax=Nonomuraea lactucae TaxID=2249762 RepID=UPI00196618D6|nr:hypothetical protein [Nonomuraea lactucae]
MVHRADVSSHLAEVSSYLEVARRGGLGITERQADRYCASSAGAPPPSQGAPGPA